MQLNYGCGTRTNYRYTTHVEKEIRKQQRVFAKAMNEVVIHEADRVKQLPELLELQFL